MFNNEIAVLLSGEAGQGINTIEQILCAVLQGNGCHVFASKEIMSRIRGGLNSSLIRVSGARKGAFRRYPEIVFSFKAGGLRRLSDRIAAETKVFFDPDIEDAPENGSGIEISLKEISEEAGGKLFINVAIAGVVSAFFQVDQDMATSYVKDYFKDKKSDENVKAFNYGYKLGQGLCEEHRIECNIKVGDGAREALRMEGSTAVACGALAGGLNFAAGYPMSPSTAVLVFLARHAPEFGIVVDQAEDEISGINMCLGAWYAGARAMVSTSGGGFALMQEGVSLAGITETPCVIHIAQRPGPGTGLPTRTEQGDLNLVLNAGHGDLPRLVYAPGSVKQAFELTRRAFDMADEFQVPVFILTDQFFIDSTWLEGNLDYQQAMPKSHTVEESKADYQRYEFTDSGISPRAIPGLGQGMVRVDSDEHDAKGEITEDFSMRIRQVEKRMKKLEQLPQDSDGFELTGDAAGKPLLIVWGSNYHLGQEVVELVGEDHLACLHFSQLYPVPQKARQTIENAERTIVLENNYSGQFASLLQKELGVRIDDRILQYNGLPFAVEDVVNRLKKMGVPED